MKKILTISIGLTCLWYVYLNFYIGTIGGPCMCAPITEYTYLGPNWPTLIPEGGCGDCGLPESPSKFFSQLLLVLFPAFLVLSGYGIYKVMRRNHNKETK